MIFASSLAVVYELAVTHLKVTDFQCILQIPSVDAYAEGLFHLYIMYHI